MVINARLLCPVPAAAAVWPLSDFATGHDAASRISWASRVVPAYIGTTCPAATGKPTLKQLGKLSGLIALSIPLAN